MTVRVNKSSFNIREKLSELERPIGLKGSELMRSETVQDARDLVSAGRKNLIINGAMQVAQRGTSATSGPNGTGEGYTTLDRWHNSMNHGTAATTFSQSTDAPSGFGYSLKYEVTTAQSTLSSSEFWILSHRLEGQHLQSIGKGTSDAKQLTLSFWVKATKTGTNNVELFDVDNSRLTTKQFTVNTSNTWEHKTLVFDADTTGAFDNDTSRSFQVQWWISAGTNWTSGSVTSWASEVAANRAPSQVNNLDTIGNVFQITGVQLEVGKNATEFEHRSYGEELALCQRYYAVLGTTSQPSPCPVFSRAAATKVMGIDLPVPMRATPTAGTAGTVRILRGGSYVESNSSMVINSVTPTIYLGGSMTRLSIWWNSNLTSVTNTANDVYGGFSSGIAFSAEL